MTAQSRRDLLSQLCNLSHLIENVTEIGYATEGVVASRHVHQLAEK